MIWHLSIYLAVERDVWSRQVLERAALDPAIVILNPEEGPQALAFAGSEESARRQREIYEASGEVSPSLCSLFLLADHIYVNREGDDDSVAALVEFVTWILRELAVSKVVDDDTDENVTYRALENPELLLAGLK